MLQLPNFPHPPVGYTPGGYDEEDIISNPSMENMRARYVEVEARPMTASSGTCYILILFSVLGRGCEYMRASIELEGSSWVGRKSWTSRMEGSLDEIRGRWRWRYAS